MIQSGMTRIYDLNQVRREIAKARRRVRPKRRAGLWAVIPVVAIVGAVAVAGTVIARSETTQGGRIPGRAIYVVDGDTIRLPGGERVRLAGIDAPEMPPRAQCEREEDLAFAAKARLLELIRTGDVALHADGRDRDKYGRLLRRVEVGGQDVGWLLAQEGLAQVWQGSKAQWC